MIEALCGYYIPLSNCKILGILHTDGNFYCSWHLRELQRNVMFKESEGEQSWLANL